MREHTVKAFDAELLTLGQNIAEMGAIAEDMLSKAIEALETSDLGLAQSVVAADPKLDVLQREIEERAAMTLVKRAPVANDLREIIVAIRLSGDIERIGDLAKSVAKRTMLIWNEAGLSRAVIGLKHMGEIAAAQLKDVLYAYAEKDVERAKAVWTNDADLDALEDSVFRDLLTFMMEDPRNISFCTHLLFCSKNIERIGDHTTNIAENVVYLVTGDPLPLERPKGAPGRARAAPSSVPRQSDLA